MLGIIFDVNASSCAVLMEKIWLSWFAKNERFIFKGHFGTNTSEHLTVFMDCISKFLLFPKDSALWFQSVNLYPRLQPVSIPQPMTTSLHWSGLIIYYLSSRFCTELSALPMCRNTIPEVKILGSYPKLLWESHCDTRYGMTLKYLFVSFCCILSPKTPTSVKWSLVLPLRGGD